MSCDELKILTGEPIQINDFITINQPNIREINEFGEQKFYSVLFSLCSIPSDMKSVLWDMGINYCEISDWELFINTCRGFTQEDTGLIFGDLDFSMTQPMMLTHPSENEGEGATQETVLVFGTVDEGGNFVPDENRILTENDYLTFIPYVREMIGYTYKPEKAANKITRDVLIDEDRRKRARAARENKPYESNIVTMIITLVNCEEFSYNYQTVLNCTIYQLMKSYIQIQKKKAACALYQGSMSGFVDTSKINKDAMQWIYTKPKE